MTDRSEPLEKSVGRNVEICSYYIWYSLIYIGIDEYWILKLIQS